MQTRGTAIGWDELKGCLKVKVNFEIYIADRKATVPVYRQSFFCSAVLTPQHYHWYAASRFALPGG